MIFGKAVLIYLAGTTIALRELVASAKRVIASVEAGILTDARKHLSMIVGRDTEGLSDEGVLRATVETLAENLSDGVIAPVFYLVLGGLPLAIAYKAINTLDSMIGYKNEKYIRFGWAAAKLDDVANYIPARITGVLIIVSAYLLGVMSSGRSKAVSSFSGLDSFTIMLRDGRKHTSPNSGMPEAAVAGALGIRLGGPSTYGGRLFEKPFIGDENNGDYLSSAHKTITLIGTASALSAAVAAIVLRMRDLA
jgi:adenosylcobinamide-phosphate synthase